MPLPEEDLKLLSEALDRCIELGRIDGPGLVAFVDKVASGEQLSVFDLTRMLGHTSVDQLFLQTARAFEEGKRAGRDEASREREDLYRAAAITGYVQRYSPLGAIAAAESVVDALRDSRVL